MNAMMQLALNEGRLLRRDLGSILPALVLPLVLVLAWGSVPDVRAASEDLGGLRALDVLIVPVAVSISIGMMGLFVVPVTLAGYREKGILRRLSVTPASPIKLLAAQLMVSLATALIGIAIALIGGGLVFDVPLPPSLLGFVLTLVLGTSCLFTLGLLVAAVVPTATSANAVAMLLFFPMLLLGGFFVPREALPAIVGKIGDFTPMGSVLQALRDSWSGDFPSLLNLGVLAVLTVVFGLLAARLFRWE